MTEDGISRRQVLRAASVAGGLGIASGAGTQALLSDTESFLNGGFAGGTFDLRVKKEDLTWSNHCEWDPTLDEEDHSAERVPLHGGYHVQNWGVLGIALTVCDNPGRVTVELERTETDDDLDVSSRGPHEHGGQRKELSKKPDGAPTESNDIGETQKLTEEQEGKPEKSDGPRKSQDDPGKKSDVRETKPGDAHDVRSMGGGFEPQLGYPIHEPYVELRAGTCKGAVLADGSLSSVVASLEGGVPLETGCTYLGKLEALNEGESFTAEDGTDDGEDRFVFDHEGESVTVEITGREYKDDGEVKAVDLTVDGAKLCRVMVKGGSGYETFSPDCVGTASVAAGDNHGGQQSAISHLKLYVCGEENPCIPCTPEDPFKLFLYWVGGLRQEKLDLVFSAEQCRHTGDGGSQ